MKLKIVDATLMAKKPESLDFYKKLHGENLDVKDHGYYFELKDQLSDFDFAIVPNEKTDCTCLTYFVDNLEEGIDHLKKCGLNDEDLDIWDSPQMKGLYFHDVEGRKMIMIENPGAF